MVEVLSQEEIDGLLSAIGKTTSAAGEPPDPGKTLWQVMSLLPNDLAVRLKAVVAGWDPKIAEPLQPMRLSIWCLTALSDRTLQDLLRQFRMPCLALALTGASGDILDKIRRNLSKRNREELAQEMGRVSDAGEPEVAAARAELLAPIESILRETLYYESQRREPGSHE